MPDVTDFDPNLYLRPPRLDAQQAVALSIALLTALPKGAPAGTIRAAKHLRKATVILQHAWVERERVVAESSPVSRVLADTRIDTAWAALKMRLDAYADLPVVTYPRAARAAELVGTLFPKGLAFLGIAMEAEWAASDYLLKHIAEAALATDIDALAGAEFLQEVGTAHAAYGKALGIDGPKAVSGLLEPLRDVERAIGDYTVQVVASIDRDEPETLTSARAALYPLDRLRDATAGRTGHAAGAGELLSSRLANSLVPELPR